MSKSLKCFHEELQGRQYATMPVGLRVIEINRIVGSLDKCEELKRDFRPRRRLTRKERHRRTRMDRMFASYDSGSSLPPIEAYLYRGEYYVVDGHRRMASALSVRREFIDANVTEVVLSSDRRSQEDAVSRRAFEQETGLTKVRLANEAGYRFLALEIRESSGDGDFKAAARDWYSQVYLPACRALQHAGLPEMFPGMREGDLFVMVLRFQRELDSGFERGGDFETLLARFLSARSRLRWSLRRCPLCRAAGRLLRSNQGPGA